MYFLKEFSTITMLGALLAMVAPAPAPVPALEAREDLTDRLAEINIYSGTGCGGNGY